MRERLWVAGMLAAACVAPTPMMVERGTSTAAAELERAGGPPGPVSRAERLRWASDDWQAGRVRELGTNLVVIDPYVQWESDLVYGVGSEVPIVRGDALVGREQLAPGTDVRVLLDLSQGEPRVLGVELLAPDEAKRLEGQLLDLPRLRESDEGPAPDAAPPAAGWST